MPLRPACPGTEIARAPHSRRARDLRGVGSPEGSGLFGRRPAARKEAGAAPAVSRCMGQQGAVARGGGLGRPPSRSARQAERARGPGGSRQAEEDICTYCVAGGRGSTFVFGIRHTPPGINTSLEVLEVDILWPRWVARIGVTRATEACFLTADRQCTELPLLRLPRLVPEVARG